MHGIAVTTHDKFRGCEGHGKTLREQHSPMTHGGETAVGIGQRCVWDSCPLGCRCGRAAAAECCTGINKLVLAPAGAASTRNDMRGAGSHLRRAPQCCFEYSALEFDSHSTRGKIESQPFCARLHLDDNAVLILEICN